MDILLEWQPFLNNTVNLIHKVEEINIEAYLTALITDFIYVARKAYNPNDIKTVMLNMLKIIPIIGLDGEDIFKAFELNFKDFEDALQSQCAYKANIDYIVTRNEKDFKQSKVKAIHIDRLLEII